MPLDKQHKATSQSNMNNDEWKENTNDRES